MSVAKRILRTLLLLPLSPFLIAFAALALAVCDVLWAISALFRAGSRPAPASHAPRLRPRSASVVIPNWNGKDLLEKYLPSVVEALAGNADNEIVLVDNGSSDGSAAFVKSAFPGVKLLELPRNLGFGGGCNAGVRAARNDIVVLLNSDMCVDRGFLDPLLDGFTDDGVFAVSCQIFFSDPNKLREETGLTQGCWQDGALRVRHRDDPAVNELFPVFYAGGGSCACDREKFLELGGFDPLYEPFYLEDTDLSYAAWKRGWKVLYQPRSIAYHEHRGSIGKFFTRDWVEEVLRKNCLLFAWKNIHEWRRLGGQLLYAWAGAALAAIFGNVPLRPNCTSLWRAFCQLPGALRARWRAHGLAAVSDTEAFRRPLGGYFRDRFAAMESAPGRPRVLFVAPYPICPPVHGGGVFMYQTLRALARLTETHVVEALESPQQAEANRELRDFCASAEWVVHLGGRADPRGLMTPYAVREFVDEELSWLIHRQMYLKKIDLLQLEYTSMAQFGGDYRRIAAALFEHDIYFQSVGRLVKGGGAPRGARYEYLRALRYELRTLPRFDQVQVCTEVNRRYLLSFLPRIAPRLRAGLRAGIDASRYSYRAAGREPLTMLFLGSFRHTPNIAALEWFVRSVMPLILAKRPEARLAVVGSEQPPAIAQAPVADNLDMLGFLEDVREPLARYSVFVCPILAGSGVRVKLLEAFAAGIPTVSTRIGAEGLAQTDSEFCRLADSPEDFAAAVLEMFDKPEAAAAMAARARAEVEANWDMAAITRRLADSYRELVREKRR
jgi:O-antigen biosynthesis protein